MRYPQPRTSPGTTRLERGSRKAEKHNDMWTVHIGSRDVVIISDDAFYSAVLRHRLRRPRTRGSLGHWAWGLRNSTLCITTKIGTHYDSRRDS